MGVFRQGSRIRSGAFRFFGIAAFTVFFIDLAGAANCTSPAGIEGEMQWIAPNMKYCNGTGWQAMNNTVTASTCSTTGQISYNSSKVQFCNGTNWVETAPTTNYGTCTAVDSGKFYYDTTGKYYWYCNATNWRRMGP